jgi:hypothetical protein
LSRWRESREAVTEKDMNSLHYDCEEHSKVLGKYREEITQVRDLIDIEFPFYPNPMKVPVPYDEKDKTLVNVWRAREQKWWVLRYQELGKAEDKKRSEENMEIPAPGSLYQRSESDAALKIRFTSYMKTQPSKGTRSKLLSNKTIKMYINAIFSEKETGVLTALKRIYEESGSEFKLCDFMFDPMGQKRPLDHNLLLKTVLPETSGMNGSSASAAICGLLQLLDYFKTCALYVMLDPTEERQNFMRMSYLHILLLALTEIKKHVRSNSQQSKLEAKIRKKLEKLLDPDSVKRRLKAFDKYYMSEHMKEVLNSIMDMVNEAKNTTGKFRPKYGDYLRINYWLMAMFVFVNGQRLQAAELLLDVHILSQQRASVDAYKQVHLDRDVLKGEDLAQYTIGDLSLSEKLGKTGKIELLLPQSVAMAVTHLMYLKKRIFGMPTRNSNLFVNLNGKAIHLNSLYRSKLMRQVYAVMGIRLTAMHRRRGVSTKQRKKRCKGNSGIGNSAETQETIYNEKTEEVGIKNKIIANRRLLKKEASSFKYDEIDPEVRKFYESQQKENTLLSRTMIREEAVNKEFAKNFNEKTKVSLHQKLYPIQRFRLVHSIYRLDSIEWSCLFFCGDGPPSNPTRMSQHFKRYLFMTEGQDMDMIRIDMAKVAANYPQDDDLFLKLTKLILNSFRQGYYPSKKLVTEFGLVHKFTSARVILLQFEIFMSENQCFGSALVSMRIGVWVQLFTSIRVGVQ